MRSRTFADLDRVVALGGGHSLGRVISSFSSLGSRLTGIVTTADNGGSTGRVRCSGGGVAWGDMRNCINQLVTEPSMVSVMPEYRFSGNGELFGHNLGDLMLKALDHLNMRSLEAISLIRDLLKVDAFLIPTSEQPVGLMALDHEGHEVYGEVNIDRLDNLPQELMLTPPVSATHEAVEVIAETDLILIGPSGLYTDLLSILLLDEIAQALRCTPVPVVSIDNLGRKYSLAARLLLMERIAIMERYVGKRTVDTVIIGPRADVRGINDRLVIQMPLEASDVPYRRGRVLLYGALEKAIQLPG